jgi:hypothetical protein
LTAGAGRGRLLSMPGKQKNTAASETAPGMGKPGRVAWGLR